MSRYLASLFNKSFFLLLIFLPLFQVSLFPVLPPVLPEGFKLIPGTADEIRRKGHHIVCCRQKELFKWDGINNKWQPLGAWVKSPAKLFNQVEPVKLFTYDIDEKGEVYYLKGDWCQAWHSIKTVLCKGKVCGTIRRPGIGYIKRMSFVKKDEIWILRRPHIWRYMEKRKAGSDLGRRYSVPADVEDISVGSDGTKWYVRKGGGVDSWSIDGSFKVTQVKQYPEIKFKQVSCGSADHVAAVATDGGLYIARAPRENDPKWEEIGDGVKQVSVDKDGYAAIIDNEGKIYLGTLTTSIKAPEGIQKRKQQQEIQQLEKRIQQLQQKLQQLQQSA